MAISEDEMERLSFIRHLFLTGVEQADAPRPLSSKSILTLHDSVEFFLILAKEHYDLNPNNFKDYWNEVKQNTDKELGQKSEMDRLNETRANLKHRGIRPDEADIESLRSSTRVFFRENTPKLFDIEFSEISLVGLIKSGPTERFVGEAQEELEDNKIVNSLSASAKAFKVLLDDYKLDKTDREEMRRPGMGPVPFRFNKLDDPIDYDSGSSFENQVWETLYRVTEVLEVICLGINYRRYAKFDYLTPSVSSHVIGGLSVDEIPDPPEDHGDDYESIMTAEDAEYCIDFVIESALLVQEFDFSLYREPE